MKQNSLTILALFASSLVSTAANQEWKKNHTTTPNNVAEKHSGLLAYCRDFTSHRYMIGNSPKHPPAFEAPPGWKEVWNDPRMIECRYTVKDPGAVQKHGRVVLFNPTPEQLATWIVNAVRETERKKGTYDECLALCLAAQIKSQSSGQFPVVGVVWEDIDPSDGRHEAYPFLDGVTMKNSPAEFYSDGSPKSKRTTRALDEATLAQALKLRWNPGVPAKYARVGSTTREMVEALYQEMGIASPLLDGANFAKYVREQHIAAMNGSRNELLVAKLLFYRTHGKWTQ